MSFFSISESCLTLPSISLMAAGKYEYNSPSTFQIHPVGVCRGQSAKDSTKWIRNRLSVTHQTELAESELLPCIDGRGI